MTNGVSEGVVGAVPVEGLLFVGGTESVKREPEDLTRRTNSPADRGVLCDRRRSLLPPPPPDGDSPPALDVPPALKDDLDHHVIKEELEHSSLKVESGDRPRANHTLVIQAPQDSADKMSAGTGSYIGGFSAASPQSYEHVSPYLSPSPQPYTTSTSPVVRGSSAVHTVSDNYYRDYYSPIETQYSVRQEYSPADTGFADRYPRPAYKANGVSNTLTVDLPSPADSGISADAVTPGISQPSLRLRIYAQHTQIHILFKRSSRRSSLREVQFLREEKFLKRSQAIVSSRETVRLNRSGIVISPTGTEEEGVGRVSGTASDGPLSRRVEVPVVPSIHRRAVLSARSPEALSSSDGESLAQIQRAAISYYLLPCCQHLWFQKVVNRFNRFISVAIQCLSTDFSSQKGVKGLPLHIQVDTYEDPRDAATLVHRGYCQIKVFCDKGAERKTRDEERRAAKRRMAATTRKKYEDLYHQPCDRSEFYSMSDLTKPPVLFTPRGHRMSMELQGFYGHDTENGQKSEKVLKVNHKRGSSTCGFKTDAESINFAPYFLCYRSVGCLQGLCSLATEPEPSPAATSMTSGEASVAKFRTIIGHVQIFEPRPYRSPSQRRLAKSNSSSYKFHYSFPQPYGDGRKELTAGLPNGSLDSPMADVFSHVSKRSRLTPPLTERLMLYVKQDGEEYYTPLHLVPPSTVGLLSAIEEKYKIPMQSIKNVYRKNRVGVMANGRRDAAPLLHEDIFQMEVQHRDAESYDLTLTELAQVDH
nr:uncharacterized protein LOC113802647 [Penaeus vannamei]